MQIKKILIHSVLIIILLAISLFLVKNNHDVNLEELNYLRQNNVSINDTNDLSIIDDDIQDNQALVVAELHGVKANYEFKYAFISYMNKKVNLKNILVEVSFSTGYLLNEYIQLGDELLLDIVFSYYKGSTFWTKEEYEFYQKLYQYNKELPDNEKISIYGIDIEHSLDSALFFYNYFTKQDIQTIDELMDLKTDEPLIDLLKNNISYHKSFYQGNIDWQFRENKMYANYLFLTNYYQINQFYAQLGAKHCLKQVGADNYKSLVYFLNNDSKSNVFNKVTVVQTFYKDSKNIEALNVNDELYYRKSSLTKTYYANTLDEINHHEMTLYKLNNYSSPFRQSLIWYIGKEKPDDYVTIDYFQYILIINQSEACTPLKKTNSAFEIIISYIKNLF